MDRPAGIMEVDETLLLESYKEHRQIEHPT